MPLPEFTVELGRDAAEKVVLAVAASVSRYRLGQRAKLVDQRSERFASAVTWVDVDDNDAGLRADQADIPWLAREPALEDLRSIDADFCQPLIAGCLPGDLHSGASG
jgi:hypothetical protein